VGSILSQFHSSNQPGLTTINPRSSNEYHTAPATQPSKEFKRKNSNPSGTTKAKL